MSVAGLKLLTELPGFSATSVHAGLWAAVRKGLVDKISGGSGAQGGTGRDEEEQDFEEMQVTWCRMNGNIRTCSPYMYRNR